jgi:DNA replication protein DnaC
MVSNVASANARRVPAGPATSPNALLIGPPGVGTTILATALDLKAAHAGYRVYYTTAADLVAPTTRSAIDGRRQTMIRTCGPFQKRIVDH